MNRLQRWTAGTGFTRLGFTLLGLALLVAGAGCDRNTANEESAKPERPKAIKSVAKKPVADEKPAESAAPTTPKPPEQTEAESAEEAKPQAAVVVAKARPTGVGILTEDPLDSPNPSVPSVAMSDQHAGTCLVKVGDTMPGIVLPDINGDNQDLQKSLGERLTIVLFWSPENRSSVEELNELAAKVASQLHPQGVRIFAICEHGTAETAKQIAEEAGASFPVVIDEDGAMMSHVATSKLPRTYLLDPTGKILWFDIEYSHPMWRELREALRALIPANSEAK
ncbi:MAG TPA: redoxin domain-containing protein [Pirellulales bacterium]|nr:redoxin domain-containing protein [Pirellulales bacterium]